MMNRSTFCAEYGLQTDFHCSVCFNYHLLPGRGIFLRFGAWALA